MSEKTFKKESKSLDLSRGISYAYVARVLYEELLLKCPEAQKPFLDLLSPITLSPEQIRATDLPVAKLYVKTLQDQHNRFERIQDLIDQNGYGRVTAQLRQAALLISQASTVEGVSKAIQFADSLRYGISILVFPEELATWETELLEASDSHLDHVVELLDRFQRFLSSDKWWLQDETLKDFGLSFRDLQGCTRCIERFARLGNTLMFEGSQLHLTAQSEYREWPNLSSLGRLKTWSGSWQKARARVLKASKDLEVFVKSWQNDLEDENPVVVTNTCRALQRYLKCNSSVSSVTEQLGYFAQCLGNSNHSSTISILYFYEDTLFKAGIYTDYSSLLTMLLGVLPDQIERASLDKILGLLKQNNAYGTLDGSPERVGISRQVPFSDFKNGGKHSSLQTVSLLTPDVNHNYTKETKYKPSSREFGSMENLCWLIDNRASYQRGDALKDIVYDSLMTALVSFSGASSYLCTKYNIPTVDNALIVVRDTSEWKSKMRLSFDLDDEESEAAVLTIQGADSQARIQDVEKALQQDESLLSALYLSLHFDRTMEALSHASLQQCRLLAQMSVDEKRLVITRFHNKSRMPKYLDDDDYQVSNSDIDWVNDYDSFEDYADDNQVY